MAEYSSKTIKELLTEIDSERVVLPAMQRNFVWGESKICDLFDSLMRNYPIGTFLFWEVDENHFKKYVFNQFIKNYDEYFGKMQRGDRATADFSDYTAVLDGQQRITSLYIGTQGKYRTHIKRKPWDNPNNYIDRFLCIDILKSPIGEEEYHFEFIPEERTKTFLLNDKNEYEYWIKVSDIYKEDNIANMADIIDTVPEDNDIFPRQKQKESRKILSTLYKSLCDAQNVNYYLAKDKSLTEVVDIFVRVNSGGEKLDPSDLMLSIAAGEQGDSDIHVKIKDAIDEINNVPQKIEEGFKVDKELLLTAGLYFTGAESLSLKNSDNYAPGKMNEIFKDHWDAIVDALKCAVDYIEYLGFVGNKLSRNSILPIAYYFYKNQLTTSHKKSSSKTACCDRIFIRQWLLRVIINSVFSDGTGATLLQIRNVLDTPKTKCFPLKALMEKTIKKPLKIEESQIDEILDIKYGDTRIVPLFNELEHVSARPNDQVDHIWARAILSSKKGIKRIYPTISEDNIKRYKEQMNRLANLQLLDSVDNNEKSDNPFDTWLESKYPAQNDRQNYLDRHFIPRDTNYHIEDFLVFINKREKVLVERIKEAFPSDFNQIVSRYVLEDKI